MTSPSTQSRRRSTGVGWLPASGLTLLAASVAAPSAAGNLPIPCIAGTCGPNVTSFSGGNATATQTANQLTVHQTSSNALLNWQSFNISQSSSVTFVQPSATALAINEIYQGSPSQIFGSLTANGRIYLINQNGIMFGSGAQVNVAGLVASSLNLTASALANGIAQTVSGDPTSPAFQATPGVPSGAVSVSQGATLNATGGQIFLFAPQVSNQGTITTPDGQTILAAGSAVYLAVSQDPSVRGLIVAVDAGGTVTNGAASNASVTDPNKLIGQIVAQRGNVTLMGLAVNQDGLVSANTSVRANGSIRLIASDRSHGGTLTLGANSVTEAPLDITDTSLAVDATVQQKSSVALRGFDVDIAGGASVIATSGNVTVTASASGAQGSTDIPPAPSGALSDDSRIYIADGALIDVSGATATLPMSSNVLQVQLRGSELADDPTQRNGALRGQTVNVDVRQHGVLPDGTTWVGTPLADLTADVATIQRGVFERNEIGGSVTLQSSGDVIVGSNVKVNVSGGASDYQGGFLNTSSVIGANGQLYDIASASPNIVYTGVANSTSFSVTDPRWGVTTVYNGIFGGQGRYEAGYVQGADAGSLGINAPHVIFDGELLGNVQIGPFQRNPPTALLPGQLERSYDQVPEPAVLMLGPGASLPTPFAPPDLILSSIDFAPGPVLPGLKNPDGSPFDPLTDAWPSTLTQIVLNPGLIGTNAAGRIELQVNGTIMLPVGVDLHLPTGGSFNALASNIDIGGTIAGSGAVITLETIPTVANASGPSGVTLERTGVLEAAGAWVNDNPMITPAPATSPLVLNGGQVTIGARDGNIALEAGALIDVSGGAQLGVNGTFSAGTAGKISITTSAPDLAQPTQLSLGATLRGFAFQNGGILSLSASAFCVTGGAACESSAVLDELSLAPGFFAAGGFASYSLDANFGALELTAQAQLNPVQQNFLVNTALYRDPSAQTVFPLASTGILPMIQRGPVNLSFSSEYVPPLATDVTPATFGSAPGLSLDRGAKITLDPQATVVLSSNTRIIDDGLISSPGGSVTMTVTTALAEPTFIAGHQIWLGPQSSIDVSGTVQAIANDRGNYIGNVLDGGTVTLSAQRGAVELQPGSLINVSGTSAIIDVPQVNSAGVTTYKSSNVASAGGAIDIAAAEAVVLSGTMLAASGNPAQVPNGTFSLVLDANNRYGPDVFGNSPPPYPYDPRVIVVSPVQPPIAIAAGLDLPVSLEGQALVSAAALSTAGFDAVSLRAASLDGSATGSPAVASAILLNGNVSLNLGRSLTLDAAGFISSGGQAVLSAPYVSLGQSLFNTQNLVGATTAGPGSLQINAAMIDLVGHSAFGNFATVTLNSSGDIRANGVQAQAAPGAPLDPQLPGALNVSGSLDLVAQQIYPSTLSAFAFTAGAGGSGNISIEPAAGTSAGPLLSAGGTLSFTAAQITQAGTVRAPLGSIVMNGNNITLAAGSTTSTSADGQLIPFGTTQLGGVDWVFPFGANEGLVYGTDGIPLPVQSIQLFAASVNIAKGSIVDLKGGGDLLATEFVPGPTGTVDVLATSGAFAILPTSNLAFAPTDPYYSAGSGVQPGQSVYLSGGAGLPAGTYAILPARYALLPGAYYVTPVSGYQDLTAGQQILQPDGSVIVSGRDVFATTNLGAARTSGFDIQPGSAVQNLAQYALTDANAFFLNQASSAGINPQRLPLDAGTLALSATSQLSLNGVLQALPAAGGRGAAVDISSSAIRVVGDSAPPALPNVLDLDATSLTDLGAESILLGGVRSESAAGLQITTQATSVEIASGATLKAPELLFAATNTITIDGGATVSASGNVPNPDLVILTSGDGALLRVASAGNPLVTRSASPGLQGQVAILPGAAINATGGSVEVDAASSATFGGSLNLAGGSLAISGGQISLGNVPNNTPGIVLSSAVLSGFSLADLSLASRTSIDFYDGANLSSNNLSLSAGALRGFESGNLQVSASDMLTLSGSSSSSSLASTGSGTGTLSLQGGNVSLQAGVLDISGFSSATLTSQGVIDAAGVGALSVGGNLNLQAALLTAGSGAQWQVNVNGTFAYSAPTNPTVINLPAEAALGASIAISAQSVAFNSAAQLHSGNLSLTASGAGGGDVTFGSAANIDLSGVATIFDSVSVPSRAGTLLVQSQYGSVTAAAGSRIDVAALDDSIADSGALSVQAVHGQIDLNGTLLGRSADISADAQSLGDSAALEASLVSGGFTGNWTLHLRGPGDLLVGASDAIVARAVSLSADQGNVDVEGSIGSSSHAGGFITLAAQNNVIVNGTLDARPKANGDANGQIELFSQQGGVLVGSGATIEAYDPSVSVQSMADGGLWIRAPQSSLATLLSGTPSTAGLVLAGNLQGLRSVTIEGFRVESPSTPGILGAADVLADVSNPIYADAANFMSSAPALLAALGSLRGPAPQIVPGVEIDSSQSLTLTTPWLLDQWRFNGMPGVLTLRSTGDLTFAASLSDGFTGTGNVLTSTSPSWSYRLVAGADLTSSNPLAVQPLYVIAGGSNGMGSLTVAAGTPARGARPPSATAIRTGTGNIDIAAANDVILASADSVIYTAGIASNGITYSSRGQLNGLLYPTQGGDIHISAGEDVVGASTADLVTNWLWRVGTPASRQGPTSTAWTVNFAEFEQGVGALGGGNLSVTAGRNINDLSVSVPTIGRQVGSATPTGSDVQVINSGDITLRAGNDVAGGTLYEGAGTAVVVAGNQITQSPTVTGLYPMVLLGDASATLSAGAGATLAGVANPTLLPQGRAQGANTGANTSFFSTYGPDSGLTLRTVAGTAELLNDTNASTSVVIAQYSTLAYDTGVTNPNDTNGVSVLRIYPGTLAVESLRGGLDIANTLTMYPDANGSVNLLAHDGVKLGSATSGAGSFEIIQSNADPSLLPSVGNPQGGYQTVSDQLNSVINLDTQTSLIVPNAPVPVHLTGSTPDSTVSRIVALTGDVLTETAISQLYFAAPARIIAGQDVQNLVVDFTNLESKDVSAIIAGRDVTYSFSRTSDGQIAQVTSYIDVDGPGTLEVVAGRNVNLGTSNGVTSRGNLDNTGLPSGGADISVETGIGNPSAQNYSTFINDYLVNSTVYSSNLIAFMQPILGGAPSAAQALSAFQALPTIEQAPLINAIFFDELLASGTNAANPGPLHNNFTQGYAAIGALFPGGVPSLSQNQSNPYAGDISLYFSRIYTIDGGSIDLLAPGGLVNVGLATLPSSFGITKLAADLGLVAQSSGNVNSYSYGNFEVNESRVFAADGGNILIWSTQGNIDAGRGSKTAISAPAPTITYVNGVPTITFPAALAGSGIQTLATSEGVSPGNVALFAPNGVVNANDAGIVAGNLTIAATAVLGASNIKISGVSVGVPVEVTGVGASLAAASAVGSSASQAATESAGSNANRAATVASVADAALSWLDVFVEGFGPETCKPNDVECLKRQPLH
jgi:filamentous hemagglutinin